MNPKKGNSTKRGKNKLTYNAYNDFIYQQLNIMDKSNINKLGYEVKKHLEYARTILKDTEIIFKELI